MKTTAAKRPAYQDSRSIAFRTTDSKLTDRLLIEMMAFDVASQVAHVLDLWGN